MNEKTLSHNLQQLMRIHGNLSVTELANFTNIPQPTIHHILSGSTKNPRKRALEALSGFFSVSTEQLVGKASLPNTIPQAIKENLHLKTIPVIEWSMVRHWPMADVSNLHLQEILWDKKISNNSFALVVQDSSMNQSFPQNSILIFEPEAKPKDRDFVIIHRGQDDTVLFNRLFIEHNKNFIKQNLDDGNFQLTKLDHDTDRIVGKLIEVRIEY